MWKVRQLFQNCTCINDSKVGSFDSVSSTSYKWYTFSAALAPPTDELLSLGFVFTFFSEFTSFFPQLHLQMTVPLSVLLISFSAVLSTGSCDFSFSLKHFSHTSSLLCNDELFVSMPFSSLSRSERSKALKVEVILNLLAFDDSFWRLLFLCKTTGWWLLYSFCSFSFRIASLMCLEITSSYIDQHIINNKIHRCHLWHW